MPVKKQTFLPRSDADNIETEYEDAETIDRSPSDEEIELFSFVEDFNTQDPKSQIRVYEAKEAGPNTRGQLPLAYLFTFAPGQLTSQTLMDQVRETYGPGNYEAHVYAPHPGRDNRLTLARKLKFEIGSTREEKDESPLPFARRRRGGETPSDLIASLAQMMDAQQRRTEELMRQVLQQQNPAPYNPLEMMQQMLAMMAGMQQLMPKPEKATGFLDELQKFAMIREILGDMGGGGGDSENGVWLKLIDKFGPVLTGALQHSPQASPQLQLPIQARPQALPQPQPQPQPTKQNPAPRAQAQPQKELDEMKANVDALVSFAKMGISPEYVAQQILERTPEANEEKLYDFIADEKCIEKMAALNPEVSRHREFFEAIRGNILAAFEEVSPEEPHETDVIPDLSPLADSVTLGETAKASEDETGKPA